jgi:hypothetical protein
MSSGGCYYRQGAWGVKGYPEEPVGCGVATKKATLRAAFFVLQI